MSNELWTEEGSAALDEHISDVLTDLTAQVMMFADYAPHDVVAMSDERLRDTLAVNFGAFLKEHYESIRFEELRGRFKLVIDAGLDDGEPDEDEDESN